MPDVPSVTLNNGVEIPQLGFGVFQIEPARTAEATLARVRGGLPTHRHCRDVRQREGGRARRYAESASTAADIFITSKLNNGYHAHDDALKAIDQSLSDLRLDYVDLFLIHWPLPDVGDYVETWKAMEEIYATARHGDRRLQLPAAPPPAPAPGDRASSPRSTRSRCIRT